MSISFGRRRSSSQRDWRRTLAISLLAAYLAADALLLAMATLLRPIADDYCEGYVARLGFFGSISHWWDSWSGDVHSLGWHYVVVGFPLAKLPWQWTSALGFLSASVGVSLGLAYLSSLAGSPNEKKLRDKTWFGVSLILVGMATYVLYWWVPATIGIAREKYLNLAVATTSWQTINSLYVVAPIALAILALAAGSLRYPVRWRIPLFACLGLLAGLSGVWTAATMCVAILVSGVSLAVYRSGRVRTWVPVGIAGLLSTMVGYALTVQSPGFQGRLKLTSGEPSYGSVQFARQTLEVLTQGTRMWMSLTLGLGAVFVFVSFLVLGIATSPSRLGGAPLRSRPLLWVGATFVVGALVLSLVFAAAEEFGYRAFWHYVPVGVVAFFGWALLGLGLGSSPSVQSLRPLKWLSWTLLAATLLIGIPAAIHMYQSVADRYRAWNVGSAPFGALTDLDEDWVASCWRDLAGVREVPPRTGSSTGSVEPDG